MKASKLTIPVALIIYSYLNLVYYKKWFFEFDKGQWGCFFHVLHQLQPVFWCYLLLRQAKLTYIDKQFIWLAVVYNIFLAICYIYRRITGNVDTEHLIIIDGSIIIFSSVFIRSCFKHKYFRN